ncbi:hypothetical protein BIW11_06180 [Tropilaelaps mercedesae]|uniref:Uncharacterized protein n=1 Tax=Tropilaelaps mercedesae TaxID=418985 RepID=A0A1V9XZ75_9ACAR|nr:hypothetical protein BIW11_06180 [Tropilaelaps mercedesae]
MSAAAGLLAGLCMWQTHKLNMPLPSTAVLVGINIYDNNQGTSGRGVDFAYAARAQEGSRTALYRVYQNRRVAIGFTWNNPISSLAYKYYDGPSRKQVELLTCKSRYGDQMRWVTYDEDKTEVNRCVQIGISESSREPILLARVVVSCSDCSDRGRLPAAFMPDLGFAITHFQDFQIFTDFELLCLQM